MRWRGGAAICTEYLKMNSVFFFLDEILCVFLEFLTGCLLSADV